MVEDDNQKLLDLAKDIVAIKHELLVAVDRLMHHALQMNSKEQQAMDGMIVEVLGVPDLKLNTDQMIVLWKEHKIDDLTASEFRLFAYLAKRPRVIRSRSEILDYLNIHEDKDYRCVDTHIKRLRSKMKAYDPELPFIKTVYREGYCLIR
jgi:DNA-binding response OmpR family regulator